MRALLRFAPRVFGALRFSRRSRLTEIPTVVHRATLHSAVRVNEELENHRSGDPVLRIEDGITLLALIRLDSHWRQSRLREIEHGELDSADLRVREMVT